MEEFVSEFSSKISVGLYGIQSPKSPNLIFKVKGSKNILEGFISLWINPFVCTCMSAFAIYENMCLIDYLSIFLLGFSKYVLSVSGSYYISIYKKKGAPSVLLNISLSYFDISYELIKWTKLDSFKSSVYELECNTYISLQSEFD